jgi:hypothetical protein
MIPLGNFVWSRKNHNVPNDSLIKWIGIWTVLNISGNEGKQVFFPFSLSLSLSLHHSHTSLAGRSNGLIEKSTVKYWLESGIVNAGLILGSRQQRERDRTRSSFVFIDEYGNYLANRRATVRECLDRRIFVNDVFSRFVFSFHFRFFPPYIISWLFTVLTVINLKPWFNSITIGQY